MDELVYGHGDGFLYVNGQRIFPIGFYELPQEEDELVRMAESGINLIRCGKREDLDRLGALGVLGWVPLPLHQGVTDSLQERIEYLLDHPALAVWEGPDEVVWNFTAWSHLWRKDKLGIFENQGEWWMQTPVAINYSEERAKEIIPNIKQAIQYIRSVDEYNRQFWINEARDSDLKFVRQYMDYIDITGCDDYPITENEKDAARVGDSTNRWRLMGKNRPVWMVLQGFSWSDLEPERGVAYPSFRESRLMAYDCIAYGARGILYWGSSYLQSPGSDEFRSSLYALTSELSALQPFLTSPDESYVKVNVIEGRRGTETQKGVKIISRRIGREWLIILINEDNIIQMGVEVTGLGALNNVNFVLLYGDEIATVSGGGFVTRMMPHEVKIFATSQRWETNWMDGRAFLG
ncbi:hypothetical protein GF312_04420 [Candidatus Poribacteria bacterium]|nr:hypothetical protein [Candidatus Poribacteria bacterium]